MKKVFLVLLLFTTVSCKKGNKDKIKPPVVEQKDVFTLAINAIIENDDEFILLFLEEGQINVTKKNSVVVNVLGSQEPQELTFKIKEEVLPTKLFLTFGNNQKAQKITFLTTYLSYGENSFSIENDKFFQFFMPNNYIEFDRENFIATAKEVGGVYKPRFGSRNVLIDKIFYDF
jgi:hypothetical protein